MRSAVLLRQLAIPRDKRDEIRRVEVPIRIDALAPNALLAPRGRRLDVLGPKRIGRALAGLHVVDRAALRTEERTALAIVDFDEPGVEGELPVPELADEVEGVRARPITRSDRVGLLREDHNVTRSLATLPALRAPEVEPAPQRVPRRVTRHLHAHSVMIRQQISMKIRHLKQTPKTDA